MHCTKYETDIRRQTWIFIFQCIHLSKQHTKELGFEVLTAVVRKSINFWDITPCSLLSVNRHNQAGGRCRLLAYWFLAEIISSILRMKVICSSETSVDTQQTTRRYIPEIDTLH
jgi:hypothetical protein